MNKDEFKKLISESIEIKLREVLPSILDKYFTEIHQQKTSQSTIVEGNIRQTNVTPTANERSISAPQSKPVTKIQYAKDPILNALLNETVSKIPQDGPSALSGNSGPSVMDNVSELPPSIAKVLNRNYGNVLKLSSEKSKNK